MKHNFDYEVLNEIYDSMELQVKDLYIVIQESDLVNLVKQVRDKKYKLGHDIGIISYNDTPLKDLLGITVISTDFQKMGNAAAEMILSNQFSNIKNDFNFINRFSA
jgi:DNA-binding LacI/PurR family transcriptional regulator